MSNSNKKVEGEIPSTEHFKDSFNPEKASLIKPPKK